MMRAFLVLIALLALTAQAHIGSPDVFHEGSVGPYPARITIRMPNVVPGRAEINVRVETNDPVEVSFLPLYSATNVKNAPPPDIGRLVEGETNLYVGELWLMSFGAYSVEIGVKGPKGEGVTQIPVTSVAIRQLPMPSLLSKVLLALATILVVGGIGIAAAAGREATLPSGESPNKSQTRKGLAAAAITAIVFVLALAGGLQWWEEEEKDFRRHLREGAWPDLEANVRVEGSDRILRLVVGPKTFNSKYKPSLIPDHGKLMHVFLISDGEHDAFAHLHPVRKDRYTFEVAVPPLPDGRYSVFCDLTFEGGASSTAKTSVVLPSVTKPDVTAESALKNDPDDSWATLSAGTVPVASNVQPTYRLPTGEQIVWKTSKPPRVDADASLRFEVLDASGKPLALEPYMGMLSHAAVLRSDGTIFAHLHPVGNFSMAAQSFFENKLTNEVGTGGAGKVVQVSHDHHAMHHTPTAETISSVYLPYEFPESGKYRIWVQVKAGGRVLSAAFDANVGE